MYVATMDTGGISYSGDEYIALGMTEEEAREAIVRAFKERNPDATDRYGDEIPMTADGLNEYYGINVVQVDPGQCVVE